MAKCPLCTSRSAKRRCPAKHADICSVCCATKREIEIECPSDCRYLRQGRSYAARTDREGASVPHPRREFSAQFRRKNAVFITVFAECVLDEREARPELLDADVRSAFEALKATARTLDSGIYYETLPESGAASLSLYQRARTLLDEMIRPREHAEEALPVGDAPDVIDFVLVSVELHSGGRPKSRRFLDWLAASIPRPERPSPPTPGGLIVP